MSMGDAWKRAFNDMVAGVDPLYRKARPKLEVLENSALTLKSHDAGPVKAWVHLPPSHPNWKSPPEPQWTVLRNELLDGSNKGHKQEQTRKRGDSEVRREAVEEKKELQARSEEERNQQMNFECWPAQEGDGSIGSYLHAVSAKNKSVAKVV